MARRDAAGRTPSDTQRARFPILPGEPASPDSVRPELRLCWKRGVRLSGGAAMTPSRIEAHFPFAPRGSSVSAPLHASPPLLRQPHRVELIVEVVAGRYRPATHAGSVRHDTGPLERGDVVCLLLEEPPLEGAIVSSALRRITRPTLAHIGVVHHGMGVPAVVG